MSKFWVKGQFMCFKVQIGPNLGYLRSKYVKILTVKVKKVQF